MSSSKEKNKTIKIVDENVGSVAGTAAGEYVGLRVCGINCGTVGSIAGGAAGAYAAHKINEKVSNRIYGNNSDKK
jgi:outer membrane lipoprotein SlyB